MATPRATFPRSRQVSTAAATPAALSIPPQTLTAPPLPPPGTFDFMPPLYNLLQRLQQPLGLQAPPVDSEPTLPEGSPKKPNSDLVLPEGSSKKADTSDDGKLEISNLDTAGSALRRKIQKAKEVVKDMPDIERTVEEQEEEIEELERRIKKQKAMLDRLGVHSLGN